MTEEPVVVPETAYYYPEWHWTPDEHPWVKSLLLFFDEIALLVPDFKRNEPALADPELAGSLLDQGILRLIEPEWFVDEAVTRDLTEAMVGLIEQGVFDGARPAEFATLSMSRAGYSGEREMADSVVGRLRERGLATETEDGWTIPMHPTVRSTYLVLLAQLARAAGERHGLDLHPATNRFEAHDVIASTLGGSRVIGRGSVIDFDLETVAVDLDDVPLDEVLSFRRDHGAEHRRYMQDLRAFCRDLARMDSGPDRDRALLDRQAELKESAASLKRRSWTEFKRPKTALGFTLGLVGVGIGAASAPIAGTAIAAGGLVLGLLPDKASDSVYSYLFTARREFG